MEPKLGSYPSAMAAHSDRYDRWKDPPEQITLKLRRIEVLVTRHAEVPWTGPASKEFQADFAGCGISRAPTPADYPGVFSGSLSRGSSG